MCWKRECLYYNPDKALELYKIFRKHRKRMYVRINKHRKVFYGDPENVLIDLNIKQFSLTWGLFTSETIQVHHDVTVTPQAPCYHQLPTHKLQFPMSGHNLLNSLRRQTRVTRPHRRGWLLPGCPPLFSTPTPLAFGQSSISNLQTKARNSGWSPSTGLRTKMSSSETNIPFPLRLLLTVRFVHRAL